MMLNVNLHGERDFAYMIKVKGLEMERESQIIHVGSSNHMNPESRETLPAVVSNGVTTKKV